VWLKVFAGLLDTVTAEASAKDDTQTASKPLAPAAVLSIAAVVQLGFEPQALESMSFVACACAQ
jgi:hypothetical protein